MLEHGQDVYRFVDRFETGILAVEDYTMRNAMLHVYTLRTGTGIPAPDS